MGQVSGAGEHPSQPRRRLSPRKRYPEAASLIDELEELSALAPEEILLGVKRLLNESALTELGNVKICWEGNTTTRKVTKPKKTENK